MTLENPDADQLPLLRQYRVKELYDTLQNHRVLHAQFEYQSFRTWIFDTILIDTPLAKRRGWYLFPKQVEQIFDELQVDYRTT